MNVRPRYRRSPLLLVEWKGDDLVLLQCDSLRRFRLDWDLVNLLSRLDGWVSCEELTVTGEPLPLDELDQLTELGLVERAGAEEEDSALPHYWNPLDLAVHRRQNLGAGHVHSHGRHDAPPAAFKPLPQGRRTVLPLLPSSPGELGDVLESRRSIRSYGRRPLDLSEISSLLHHSARVVDVFHDEVLGEHALRPFPGGGARSELELYVVANAVGDLSPGAHYYDARGHALVQVAAADSHQDRINRWVGDAIGEPGAPPPQAVLLVTAVFARVMWKYRGIGLHLIYQNTGCLYQNLYLVATALDLAPCAVGAHPELETARWLGLDPLLESQVGCFLVGPRRAE